MQLLDRNQIDLLTTVIYGQLIVDLDNELKDVVALDEDTLYDIKEYLRDVISARLSLSTIEPYEELIAKIKEVIVLNDILALYLIK